MIIEKYNKAVRKINKVNEILLVLTLVAMFIVLLAQIFVRFIFFIPLPASQDFLTFLMIASVFLGSGIAVAKNKQIALEFLIDSLPVKLKNVFMIFSNVVSIAFLILIVTQAKELIIKTKGSMVGASPIPVSYYYLVVLIGCIIMIINYLDKIFEKIQKKHDGEVE